jgi:fructose-1,6-bisphosphatase/inositol monophosphatase family enzyme
MTEFDVNQGILRYCRQIILETMDHVRSRLRHDNLSEMRKLSEKTYVQKSEQNPTKRIDREAEDLILDLLRHKFAKLPGAKSYTVFSEDLGIKTFPASVKETESDLVIFIDPVDGTEFAESLQGGWALMSVYDRKMDDVVAVVAGDIFLDRLYWASRTGFAECIDFITHSWFRLDGGPEPKKSLKGARVNVLTTKAERYQALAGQTELMNAIRKADGRINLSWGSNTIIQVAAGYADVAVEFAKGFATYDFLPGLYLGLKSGLTIIDLDGKPIGSKLNLDEIMTTFHRDPKNAKRVPFIAAKEPALAEQVLKLLKTK